MSLAPDPFIFQQVREYAESNQQTSITIVHGDKGTLDRATGKVGGLSNVRVVYRGKARIKPISGSSTVDLGGGEIVQRDCELSIPIDSPVPTRDDIVIVGTDDIADATVDNLVLRVLGSDAGGFFGDARRISCSGWGKSQYWQGSS